MSGLIHRAKSLGTHFATTNDNLIGAYALVHAKTLASDFRSSKWRVSRFGAVVQHAHRLPNDLRFWQLLPKCLRRIQCHGCITERQPLEIVEVFGGWEALFTGRTTSEQRGPAFCILQCQCPCVDSVPPVSGSLKDATTHPITKPIIAQANVR